MTGYLNILLRLLIWFLLTANFSLSNILIGLTIALLLPHDHRYLGSLKDWGITIGELIKAIPIAYIEALEMIFRPHRHEEITIEKVKPNRSCALVFLDIFLITFTPKTIVVNYHESENSYEVHWVRRKMP